MLLLPSAVANIAEAYLLRPYAQRRDKTSREHHEELLPNKKSIHGRSFRKTWKHCLCRCRSPRYLVPITVSFLLLVLWSAVRARLHVAPLATGRHQVQNLYILISTPDLNVELCRTVLSAEVLQYPSPTLVSWDAVPEDSREDARRRITAIRDHLVSYPERAQDHLVVLLEGPSNWFQLRPEVLLKRYYDVNRRATAILTQRHGKAILEKEGLRQSVILAASPKCGALTGKEIGCYAVPKHPTAHSPRFADLGFAIGPVHAMRGLYERAAAKLESDSKTAIDDLTTLTEIFGEQEFQREVVLRRHWSSLRQLWHKVASVFAIDRTVIEQPDDRVQLEHQEGMPDGFGLHLDYDNELGFSTAVSDGGFVWLSASSRTSNSASPADIATSMPPFWTVSGSGFPINQSWDDVSLLKTRDNRAPVVIHNSLTESFDIRSERWKKLWSKPHARKLFNTFMEVPAMPIAAVTDNNGVEQVFWPPTSMEKAGARAADGTWYPWHKMCEGEGQDLAAAIFGDGLGPWHDPTFPIEPRPEPEEVPKEAAGEGPE